MKVLLGMVLASALLARAAEVRATEFVVSDESCALLVPHSPHPNVAYKPGVDGAGRVVAPADLNGGNAVNLPNDIHVPLREPLGPGAPRFTEFVEFDWGLVFVDRKTGVVRLNGKPLTDPTRQALIAACQDRN